MAGEDQQDPAAEADPAEDPAAEPDIDWKAESRKHENRYRRLKDERDANAAAAKRLAEIEAAGQTAQEKAEAAAKAAEDRAQAAVLRIASAEVRAALTGVVPDPAAVVEDVDLSRFVTSDGEVDPEKVAAFRAKYAALAPAAGPRTPAPNPAQGAGTRAPTLAEIAADAEKSGDVRAALRAKSQQLAQLRSKQ